MAATVLLRADPLGPAPFDAPRAAPAIDPSPLRVLTMLNSFAPGGVERVALRLHGAWLAAGVDAAVLLADGSIPAPAPIANLRVLGRRAGAFGRFAALLAALPGAVRAQRPDVLFCAGNTYTGVAVCLKLLLGRRCPPIVAKISNDLVRADKPPFARWWYRRWLWLQGRCIDRFVGMAPAMRDEIAAMLGVDDARIDIIEDPALTADELARLAALRVDRRAADAGRHFVAVGRIVPQKNFGLLVDAFARAAGPDDRLTILGDGPGRVALAARIDHLGLTRAVELPGHVEPLDAWLASADALVLSSDYEGVPAVVIEALAAGLPIVATDCCVSMRHLLGDGAFGLIVPVGDVAALAGALAAIGTLPCAAPARRAAVGRFTIEQAATRYVAVMRQAALAAAPGRGVDRARIAGVGSS